MRLVDADKILEKLETGLDNPEEFPVMGLGAIMRLINNEPEVQSAQPEQRWIPCSEKLPDKDGLYLVTDDSGGVKETHESWFIECYDGTLSWDLANVTAWMPLPEPYQSEAERRTDEA